MSSFGYHYVIEESEPNSSFPYEVTIYCAETERRLWGTFTLTKWGARRWVKAVINRAKAQRDKETVVEEGII